MGLEGSKRAADAGDTYGDQNTRSSRSRQGVLHTAVRHSEPITASRQGFLGAASGDRVAMIIVVRQSGTRSQVQPVLAPQPRPSRFPERQDNK